MTLVDTLLVAVTAGGLTIAGSLANQTRQYGFEHERWKREKMEQAAVHFAELAARTQRVLHVSSWAEGEDARALINEADVLTGDLDDSEFSLHLTFGIDSHVVELGDLVKERLRKALDMRIRLLGDGPPEGDADEWIGVRKDFDEFMEETGLIRMDFTEAARSALFVQPRHKYATRLPWNRRSEPGS